MEDPAILAQQQLRSLDKLKLDAYLRRFGKLESDLYHVIRSLTYFEDAEQETIGPMGLSRERWEYIKEFFVRRAPDILR
jgi:hypothetical protein